MWCKSWGIQSIRKLEKLWIRHLFIFAASWTSSNKEMHAECTCKLVPRVHQKLVRSRFFFNLQPAFPRCWILVIDQMQHVNPNSSMLEFVNNFWKNHFIIYGLTTSNLTPWPMNALHSIRSLVSLAEWVTVHNIPPATRSGKFFSKIHLHGVKHPILGPHKYKGTGEAPLWASLPYFTLDRKDWQQIEFHEMLTEKLSWILNGIF
jgi:hypothetical protein